MEHLIGRPAAAPDVANLTLPLNMSSMYFGVAAGTFLGGQLLKVIPAAELGLVAAAFPLVALPVLLMQERQKAAVEEVAMIAEEAMSPGE